VNGCARFDIAMVSGGRQSKLRHRGFLAARTAGRAVSPQQLPLPFYATPKAEATPRPNGSERLLDPSAMKAIARLPALERLTVREVLKVVPINRSTLFRWVKNGRFPKRHKAGGWLRSDIEKWLTEHEDEEP
jgi:prophage regulatory protein